MTAPAEKREVIETDLLVVGGGPAGLAAAIRFADLARQQGSATPPSVMVIEKGAEFGAHCLSGAVLDPASLGRLIPDYETKGAPVGTKVSEDRLLLLTRGHRLSVPFVPGPLRNHGKPLVSLNQLVKWLAQQAEARGVDLAPSFAGVVPLLEGDRVAGVRTGDKGIDRLGKRRSNFEAGVEIRAAVTILAEGARGSLTKQLVTRLGLDAGRFPQVYGVGVKELWEVPRGRISAGTCVHAMGHPLKHETYGGGFLYAMAEDRVSVGLVAGLDYHDPFLDPHALLQRFKEHPYVRRVLDGGCLLRYGARAISEGGWYAVPRPYAAGVLLVGEAAGFLNAMHLKGIHLAIESGMLAGETALTAVRAGDSSAARLGAYEERLAASSVKREMWAVRNFRQAFRHGLLPGVVQAGIQMVTEGRGLADPLAPSRGYQEMETLAEYYGGGTTREAFTREKPDGRLTFDRLTDVYHSGTKHEEDQPAHLHVADPEICRTRCSVEYGNPCEKFCPAAVYEMVSEEGGGRRIQINFANCVHCKTCDVMDPYGIITWVPPEGGDGPRYEDL